MCFSLSLSLTATKYYLSSFSPFLPPFFILSLTLSPFQRKTLSVDTFRQWDDVTELLASGALKQSALERAIAKVGAYDNGEMNLEQFLKLIDIIQKQSDATKLSESYEKVSEKQQKSGGSSSSQQVFVPSHTAGGSNSKSTLSKQQQEDEDLDHLTRLITSDEIDSK